MNLLAPNLQAFEATCRLGTVHAAAHSLSLTQTAVTQRIRSLELALNTTLFVRSRRGMQVTEAGHALLKYCRQAQDLEGEVHAKLSGAGRDIPAKVVLQGPSSILRARVIPAAKKVMHAFPKLSLEFVLSDFNSGVQALKQGAADIVIIANDHVVNEFDAKKLKPERYILVGASSWKKRTIEDIITTEKIVDFDQDDKMTFMFLNKNGLRAKAREDRHFVNNTDALADLVQAGLGYSVLAEEFAKPLLESKALMNLAPGKFFDYGICAAYYARKHPLPFWKELLHSLQ